MISPSEQARRHASWTIQSVIHCSAVLLCQGLTSQSLAIDAMATMAPEASPGAPAEGPPMGHAMHVQSRPIDRGQAIEVVSMALVGSEKEGRESWGHLVSGGIFTAGSFVH